MEVISREDAKEKGINKYYDGGFCKHGHDAVRYVSNGICVECAILRIRALPKKPIHPRKLAKEAGEIFYWTGKKCHKGHIDKRYVVDGKCLSCARDKWESEEEKVRRSDYYQANIEQFSEYGKLYYSQNKESIIPRVSEHKKKNRARYNALEAAREAAKEQRTLKFSDEVLYDLNSLCISEIYQQSSDLSKLHGKVFHTDHIIPLRGKEVSGFHVWYNLQVMCGSENSSKNNSFTPYAINHLTGEVTYYG